MQDAIGTILLYFIGLIILWFLFGLPIYLLFKTAKRDRQALKHLDMLKKSGFQVDHLLNGDVKVAFNDLARKVAFVFYDTTVQYNYADITHWQWHWVEKNARKESNSLHFTLRDKNRPLIKIYRLTSSEAEHWMAKIGAILNE